MDPDALGELLAYATVEVLDAGIVRPTSTGALGKIDTTALNEVNLHLATVGLAPWSEMQGTGQITYGDEKVSYPATFSTKGANRYRLDAQTSKGAQSIRIDGLTGKIRDEAEDVMTLSTGAAAAGLFPFHIVRTAHFPGKRTSLIDHGVVTVAGAQLHRIAVETQTIGRNPVAQLPQTMVLDLYFDPATHLLTKSASYEAFTNGHSASFLRVVTYSDYRKVGTSLVPFHYTESMDGEHYWTLQLSDVQLNPTFDATYFQF